MHNMHQTILKADALLCVSTSTMPAIHSSILEARGTAVIHSDADRTYQRVRQQLIVCGLTRCCFVYI
jgi:hypothetical protein